MGGLRTGREGQLHHNTTVLEIFVGPEKDRFHPLSKISL